jgi:hypothetical protein
MTPVRANSKLCGTTLPCYFTTALGGCRDDGPLMQSKSLVDSMAQAERLRELAPEVAAAQANPGNAKLAPALMTLLALRQLHVDAAALDEPVAEVA